MRWTLPVVILTGSLAGSFAFAAEIPFSQQQMKKAGIGAYQLKAGNASPATTRLTLNGTVGFTPQGQTAVSTPSTGVIRNLAVSSMQKVGRGDTLATVYSPEIAQLQADYLKTSAQLSLARQQLQREKILFDEGIIAHRRVAEQQGAVQILQLTRQQQEKLLNFNGAPKNAINPVIRITAPVAGTVGQISVTPGQSVAAGTSLLTLQNNSDLELQLNASATQARQISTGTAVWIKNCSTAGRVKRLGNQVNSQTQTVTVYSTVPKGCGEPNQFVTATLQATPGQNTSDNNGQGWTIPNSSIVLNNNQPYVFVVKKDGFDPVKIKLGPVSPSTSTAYSNRLKAGMYVATSGTAQIKGVWQGIGAEQAPHQGTAVITNDTP